MPSDLCALCIAHHHLHEDDEVYTLVPGGDPVGIAVLFTGEMYLHGPAQTHGVPRLPKVHRNVVAVLDVTLGSASGQP